MLGTFLKFELSFWLRGMMVYIFFAVMTLLIFGAISSDSVRIGSELGNSHRNAPFVVQNFYAMASLLTLLMTTAFVNASALRDYSYHTHELIFTKPINKLGYFLGRFLGSSLVAIIPMLGVSAGVILGSMMPWNEPNQWGPNTWQPHVASLLIFAIPNALIISAVIFAISLWLRSTIAAFIGAIIFMIGYGVSQSMLSNLDYENIAILLDPFAIRTFSTETKYWTVSDQNSLSVWPTGMLLWNRIIWLSVSGAVLAFAYSRFSFTTTARGSRKQLPAQTKEPEFQTAAQLSPIPNVSFNNRGWAAGWIKFCSQVHVDFWETVRSNVFIVVILAGLLNTVPSLFLNAGEGFGVSTLPVTYDTINTVRGSLYLFLIIVIVFYSGAMVWKEREAKLAEVYDALPHPTWISYVGKIVAVFLIIAIVQSVGIAAGIASQAWHGYTRFQIGLYLTEMLVIDYCALCCLTVLAFFSHVISPNKFVGYFVFIVLMLANAFAWNLFSIETLMLKYGEIPSYIYSDMFEFAPYQVSLFWFLAYWCLFAMILSVVAILMWQRGNDDRMLTKIRFIPGRFKGSVRSFAILATMGFAVSAAWVYHNTIVLNSWTNAEQQKVTRAKYETDLSEYRDLAQPRVTDIVYNIDIFPEQRKLIFKGRQSIKNQTDQPITKLFLNLTPEYETEITIERATRIQEIKGLRVEIYEFQPPLAVGESVEMNYCVSYEATGFENSVRNPSVVQNGTFFDNQIAPQIGYQRLVQLRNRRDRKRLGLNEEPEMMPALNDNPAQRRDSYISNNSDWVNVETFISTSEDQIAIAPGSLLERWNKNGRNHFHYKVDHPSVNMYSFISAKYEVAVQRWNDVDIEVYFHADHRWNVDNMLRSIRSSLEYYTENFGPYRHKQARIIEFPRVASFAQAFPGTMPYSEGIGFIADLKDEDDIDMVYYVVAHEMAHQWWAHQVVGANMEGATLLSETLAQYSALMVMEKAYQRDTMRKFLSYEMNSYLSSRGREMLAELPLMRVQADQGYVHYRKGSVVMYYLKEMIGEDKVNKALRSIVDKFAYQGPPYPTSKDLVDALLAQTPQEYQYLIDDLFEKITLFANRTIKATSEPIEDGKYRITLDVECKKYYADEQGTESEVEVNDWIEIGAFAQAEPGRRYGKTLYRQRLKMTQNQATFQFVVDEKPELAGIDPFSLLIDRQPADNLKKPTAH